MATKESPKGKDATDDQHHQSPHQTHTHTKKGTTGSMGITGCADCTAKDAQIAELTDTLKRLQAEFENYQKRTAKETEQFRIYATAGFIAKLLPVLDSFDQAQKHLNGNNQSGIGQATNGKGANSQDGLSLIHQQLIKILDAEGVKRMQTVGTRFDPTNHEVLLTQVAERPGIVLEEFAAGYALGGRVLRHAKVKISISAEDHAQDDAHGQAHAQGDDSMQGKAR